CGGGGAPRAATLGVEELSGGEGTKGPFVRLRLGRVGRGDQIPADLYLPARGQPAEAVVIVHPGGKSALSTAGGEPDPLIATLLGAVRSGLAMDAFRTGEHLGAGGPRAHPSPAHFHAYTPSLLSDRVHA